MKNDVYELIKATDRLPSPKGIALEILRLTEDDETTVECLTAVIESDPALSGRLLRVVNSPLAGMSRKVASLSRATVLLGFRTVASLALGLSLVSENRRKTCAAFDYDAFWSESLARAVAACYLARVTKAFSPDEAFTCGLLSQVGRLAFASAYPDRYAQVLHAVGNDRHDLTQFEQDLFGIDHNALAAEMIADWHLPRIFIQVVRTQDDPDAGAVEEGSRADVFARLVHLSGQIADLLMDPVGGPEKLSSMTNKAFQLGINPESLGTAFDSIRDDWRDAGRLYSVPTHSAPTLAEIYSRCRTRREELAGAV